MSSRGEVKCSQCGATIVRVLWNYGKNRPVDFFFCNTTCKGAWQRAQREALGYTKEWLEYQYINKRRSANDIAREVGRDSKRVWEWIRDYGIPIRPRGTDYGQCIKKGSVSPMKGKKHTEETKNIIRQKAIAAGRVPYDPAVGPRNKGKYGPENNHWKGGLTPERQGFYYSD